MHSFTVDQRTYWEEVFKTKLQKSEFIPDPAHDFSHFERVVQTAKQICLEESACWEVVVPAAWLHDLVNLSKDDPRRSQASRLSADEALQFLQQNHYPAQYFQGIQHAIEAHSFSAEIKPTTLEAKVVQDADRLDGLGAIGIARCFCVTGALKRQLYHPFDPFAEQRNLNDLQYALDHFYQKLFKTAQTLQTEAGKREGQRRVAFMNSFIEQFRNEIDKPAFNGP